MQTTQSTSTEDPYEDEKVWERVSICIPLIVATTVLEIPAPSAPVECLFRTAGKCSGLYIHLHDETFSIKDLLALFRCLNLCFKYIVCESICACA